MTIIQRHAVLKQEGSVRLEVAFCNKDNSLTSHCVRHTKMISGSLLDQRGCKGTHSAFEKPKTRCSYITIYQGFSAESICNGKSV